MAWLWPLALSSDPFLVLRWHDGQRLEGSQRSWEEPRGPLKPSPEPRGTVRDAGSGIVKKSVSVLRRSRRVFGNMSWSCLTRDQAAAWDKSTISSGICFGEFRLPETPNARETQSSELLELGGAKGLRLSEGGLRARKTPPKIAGQLPQRHLLRRERPLAEPIFIHARASAGMIERQRHSGNHRGMQACVRRLPATGPWCPGNALRGQQV